MWERPCGTTELGAGMASWFSGTIKDDRGATHPPMNLRGLKKSADDPTSARHDLAKYMKDVVRAEARRGGLLAWLIPLGVIVIGAGVAGHALSEEGKSYVLLFSIILAIVVTRVLAKRGIRREIARTIVAEGICGSCGYSLRSMMTSDDGCVVCAECGAAWKAVRITAPHWDRPVLPGIERGGWWHRLIGSVPKDRDLLTPDDRGRYVRSLDSRLVLLPADRRAEVGESVVAMRRRLRGIGRIGRFVVALIVLAVFLVPGVMLARTEPSGWIFLAVAAGVSLLLAVGILRGTTWLPPRKMVRSLSDAGWCGSCGRDILALPVAEDGCVTCRGCSASWRRVPSTSPTG